MSVFSEMPMLPALIVLMALVLCAMPVDAQVAEPNYDEDKVPEYSLPNPLRNVDGTAVSDAQTWRQKRRPEILRLFEEHAYGTMPPRAAALRFETVSVESNALSGKATRKQITIHFSTSPDGPQMDLLIYLPNPVGGPAPVVVGLNFFGNHTIHDDPGINLARSWVPNDEKFGITQNKATEASRGIEASRWLVERILERGYAVATAYYGDLDPDFDDGFQNGAQPLFYANGANQTRSQPVGEHRRVGLGPQPSTRLLPN
jgi:hypothetical protein